MPEFDGLTLDAYFKAEGAAIGFPPDTKEAEREFLFSIEAARMQLESGDLLQSLIQHLEEGRKKYAGGRPDLLFFPDKPLDLRILSKPFYSVLSKVYRHNCVWNHRYPEAPRSGKIESSNFYSKINDLIRTRIVCKYLDGPEYVASLIKSFSQEKSFPFRMYPMSSELGYHAWHCYITIPSQALIAGKLADTPITLEIQLTTQLSEVISSLTHGLYEGDREKPRSAKDDGTWRWRPDSPMFRSTYLGHTLHLLEGVVQTFKEDILKLADISKPTVAVSFDNNTKQPPILDGKE